jgi:hypothetical protein
MKFKFNIFQITLATCFTLMQFLKPRIFCIFTVRAQPIHILQKELTQMNGEERERFRSTVDANNAFLGLAGCIGGSQRESGGTERQSEKQGAPLSLFLSLFLFLFLSRLIFNVVGLLPG